MYLNAITNSLAQNHASLAAETAFRIGNAAALLPN